MTAPNPTEAAAGLARWRERRDGLGQQLAIVGRDLAEAEQQRATLARSAAVGGAVCSRV